MAKDLPVYAIDGRSRRNGRDLKTISSVLISGDTKVTDPIRPHFGERSAGFRGPQMVLALIPPSP